MAFIEWSDSYSVGIKAMDDQHKKLIDLLNQLHEAMKMGKGNAEISTILKGLADYTRFHFTAEEQLMRDNNFPGLIIQQNRHKDFVTKLQEFQTEAQSKSVSTSLKVRDFLRDWLIDHISGEDKKYTKFLNDKGIH
jgi:hemerythrin